MVFVIRNTRSLDAEAMQVKLDELIRAVAGAPNSVLDLEQLDDAELDRIRTGDQKRAAIARADLRRGGRDTGSPVVGGDRQT